MTLTNIKDRDWFPKIDLLGGYIGDKFPLCEDRPKYHFLKKGATYRFLGGDPRPLWYYENKNQDWLSPEIQRVQLESSSPLYNKLCKPKNPALPTTTLVSGDGMATFDGTLGAPLCLGSNVTCSSGSLLEGRVNEANSPNTIDGCNDGTATGDDSVESIIVESVNGTDLRGDTLVNIRATVRSPDIKSRVDFWYTADASNPDWIHITTVAPVRDTDALEVSLPRNSSTEIRYTLPKCTSESGCRQVSTCFMSVLSCSV